MRFIVPVLALLAVSGLDAQQEDIGRPLGQLFDVGGRRLHLYCTGEGGPTVVLEAGASSFAIDWTLVQREIEKTHRVCSYDRAGHGWSEPITLAAPRKSIPYDLHLALEAANQKPPYIMVGASMGGLYVRRFQVDYPGEVVGMVLVDPAHEDRLFTMLNGQAIAIAELTPEQLRSAVTPGDVSVPTRSPQMGTPFDRLPPEIYKLRILLDKRLIASMPTIVTQDQRLANAETERANLATLRQVGLASPHPFGDRPIVVLSRGVGGSQAMWDVHARAAGISMNSRHTIVEGSGHEVHLFKPEVVIRAIRDVSEAVRTKSKLAPR